MENTTKTNGGIGFMGLLTIAFIVLKLTGYIKWSWIWVLSPIWMPTAIAIIFFVIIFVIRGFVKKKK